MCVSLIARRISRSEWKEHSILIFPSCTLRGKIVSRGKQKKRKQAPLSLIRFALFLCLFTRHGKIEASVLIVTRRSRKVSTSKTRKHENWNASQISKRGIYYHVELYFIYQLLHHNYLWNACAFNVNGHDEKEFTLQPFVKLWRINQ